ncbi:MAG: helix-turn-helix domain-containing protein, partial [Cyclobacteriaceae bacterium]|nr:helix-turn-helix domain-containing protein [Cyclobacteriaceae bacterium]
MKKNSNPISLKGLITLDLQPSDTLLWKLAMIVEAACRDDCTIEELSAKYGYTREYFYQVLNKLNIQGSQSLKDLPTGPKTNYKRTPEATKQVIRHRFLDPDASCEVIAQKMNQSGHPISQRSVERVVQEYGLQKKGYIKQIRQMRKN